METEKFTSKFTAVAAAAAAVAVVVVVVLVVVAAAGRVVVMSGVNFIAVAVSPHE